MLSDEIQERITQEEQFRQKVRSEIEAENSQSEKSLWNSLEIVKLLVSTLTPIVILWFGFMASDAQRINQQNYDETQRTNQRNFEESQRIAERNFQETQRTSQRVIEKRIAIYDQIGTKLNDIYCYFMFVGNWKEIKPPEIVANKRTLDKIMYTYRPLFSDELFSSYNKFIDATFKPYTGMGNDAQLRTTVEERKLAAKRVGYAWKAEWNNRFTGEDKFLEVDASYKELMTKIAAELGLSIKLSESPPKRQELPK
ncbi:MAG TPA: hypothetical protein VF596_10300 [Pyrinomonadaceae bacterium]|jgi:hypothetical protein